jgi:hypothetical protein
MNCEIFHKLPVDRRATHIPAIRSHSQLYPGKGPVTKTLDAAARTDKPTNSSRGRTIAGIQRLG